MLNLTQRLIVGCALLAGLTLGLALATRSALLASGQFRLATLYVVMALAAGAATTVPVLAPQLALYPVDGTITVDGRPVGRGTMVVLDADRAVRVASVAGARFVLIGGEPLDGRRLMWWNFVSTRKERIVAAAADWEAQRMGGIEGDPTFIPLPASRPQL